MTELSPPDASAEGTCWQYARRMYSVAARMLGDEIQAEDAIRVVLPQFARHLDTLLDDSARLSWLYRMTVRAVRSQRSKRKGARLLVPATPENKVFAEDPRDRLEAAIVRLPVSYRDTFVLVDVEHLNPGTVSNLLGLTPAEVKVRLHKARLFLRDALRL